MKYPNAKKTPGGKALSGAVKEGFKKTPGAFRAKSHAPGGQNPGRPHTLGASTRSMPANGHIPGKVHAAHQAAADGARHAPKSEGHTGGDEYNRDDHGQFTGGKS